jgi:hypothetical protein
MSTISTTRENQFLRRAFLLDAVATGGLGLALAAGAGHLEELLGMPTMLLREAGLICMVFAAWLAFALTRERLTNAMVWFAVGVNTLWVLASLGLLASGWVEPTWLGVAFVVAQALVVVVFAELQYLGMKRARQA